MSNITHDIVAKLWNLCNVLKDDGVTYHLYVTELTFLLFLKMAKETGAEQQIPADYRWGDLEARSALDRFEHYKFTLIHLGSQGSMLVQEIFANASSFIKKPATLSTLVVEIDKLDWYSARQEGLGDLYEGLLVVMPDNVLFEGNTGRQIRADLMDKCNLHTILRLPTGIFYAQGVNPNVLLFTRGGTDKNNTREVWVYDLRANMPQFGKRTVLTREHFSGFEVCYGLDPTDAGLTARHSRAGENPETARFRCFTRKEIAARGDSLDIAWFKDESDAGGNELPEPAALAREAMDELEGAMAELHGILGELGEEVGEVEG